MQSESILEHRHPVKREIQGRDIFYFESSIGLYATFFFDGDELIFVGCPLNIDHCPLP